jgi:Family of unknown function (DUF6220)
VGALRGIYRYWAAILFLAVLVQIGAAGYGAFNAADEVASAPLDEEGFENGFDFHIGFGYLVFLASLLLLLLALAGRLGRTRVLLSLGVVGLMILQVLLAWFGSEAPIVGTLHPINAVAIAGLVGYLADRSWRVWTDMGAIERA